MTVFFICVVFSGRRLLPLLCGKKPMRKDFDTSRVHQLLVGMCWLVLMAPVAQATETFVIGGSGSGLSWETAAESAPVIDFNGRPGWIQSRNVAENTNIALGTQARGGRVTSPNAQAVLRLNKGELEARLWSMVDGDHQTAFEAKEVVATGILLVIDLGARFGVDHVRFFPRPSFPNDFMKGYVLSANDGLFGAEIIAASPDKLPNKTLFTLMGQDGSNNRDTVDVRFPLQYVRYLRLQSTQRFNWEIDEIEMFGQGFVPEASYLSQVFDFDSPSLWGRLRWVEEWLGRAGKSRIAVRTRSGSRPSPEEDLDDWSAWSPPYLSANAQISSPSPRRYFQFKIDFESDGLEDGTAVDSLTFELSRPALAETIIGEIWPQEVPIGLDTTFIYVIQVGRARGFDRLEINTPAPVRAVRSLLLDDQEMSFEAEIGDRGLNLSFARQTGSHRLQVDFDTAVLRYETVFTGRLLDSQTEALPQEIEAGDVIGAFSGDDLTVRVPLKGELIHRLWAAPNPFTPNGDGINDQTLVTYDLLYLTRTVPVALKIYDLTGKLVADLQVQDAHSGRHLQRWDGRDTQDQLLPPGLYVAQVEVETDSGTERRSSIVAIAY